MSCLAERQEGPAIPAVRLKSVKNSCCIDRSRVCEQESNRPRIAVLYHTRSSIGRLALNAMLYVEALQMLHLPQYCL